MDKIRHAYTAIVESLRTEGVGGQYVQKRITTITCLRAYAGKNVSDDLEAMILDQVSQHDIARIITWPESQGFSIQIDQLGNQTCRIILKLLDPLYREVFLALCDDAAKVMAGATDEDEGVRLFHQRLGHWQSFLKQHGAKGLGVEARRGLFGELLVMRNLLIPQLGAQIAVEGWRGWKKAAQDFQIVGCALEVKTTSANIPDRIHISNVQQLDNEGMKHLFLTLVHLNENQSSGETLPGIVDDLRQTVPDSERDKLDFGLETLGYIETQAEAYNNTFYVEKQILHFRVSEEFPRITREIVPDGVKKLKYEITIDAARPCLVTSEDLLDKLANSSSSEPDE